MGYIHTTADKIKDRDTQCWNLGKENPDKRIVRRAVYYRGRKPFQIKIEYEDLGVMWHKKKEKVIILGAEG